MIGYINHFEHKNQPKSFSTLSHKTALDNVMLSSAPRYVPRLSTSSSFYALQRTLGNQMLRQINATSNYGDESDKKTNFAKQQDVLIEHAHNQPNQPRLDRQSSGTTENAGRAANQPRTASEERFNIGEGGHRFDAVLDRTQRLLTLKMKVRFNYVNLPQSWPDTDSQTQWQSNFINGVQNRWSFRYYLVPDQSGHDSSFRRIIARIQVIPVTASPHFTVNVGYATSFQQSFVSGRSATLDALDNARRSDIPQVPAEHEFGHMLGLPHVHCSSNSPDCYGVTSDEKANIMGQGSNVSARNYKAFAAAMYYFTGYNWRASLR